MKKGKVRVAALFAVIALTGALAVAAGKPSVTGLWFACEGDECQRLRVGRDMVSIGEELFCDDVIIDESEKDVSIVSCLKKGAARQLLFIHLSGEEALLWIDLPGSDRERPSLVARRGGITPLPEALLGRWTAELWFESSRRARSRRIELTVDDELFRTMTDGRPSDCRNVSHSGDADGSFELFMDCGRGDLKVVRLQPLPAGAYFMSRGRRDGRYVLYRQGKRPTWLPSEEGIVKLRDVCSGIEDPGEREDCYVSRAVCEKISDPAAKRQCLDGRSDYEFKARSSEAKHHLGAIRSTEVAYMAEWNIWVGNQPPTPVIDRRRNDAKTPWKSDTRFSILGFAPVDDVRCSYTLEGKDFAPRNEGFTARALCDIDGDGELSIWTITGSSTEIKHSGDDF